MQAPAHRGGAIILAAGRGARFGADKRRATLPSGVGLLEATVQRYAEVFTDLLVMVREDEAALAGELRKHLHLPTQAVGFAARAAGGMGYTLADAVTLIAGVWQFAFVALGDMPFVTFTTLRRLQSAMAGGPMPERPNAEVPRIVQPLYNGAPGHPVGFSRALFPALAALTEDVGARSVLHAYPQAVQRIELNDPGIVADVDTPAALEGRR